MVIAVIVILATGFAARSIGEQRAANKERDSIQSLWLAEAGLDKAISSLASTSLTGSLGNGNYSTQTSSISSTRFLITSTGGVPDSDTTNPDNATRVITAIVEQPMNQADPSGVTSAIAANGDVEIKGGATVNGDVDENAIFDFEETFGISKETMRNNATNLYTNPENNVTPVTNITWADVDPEDEMTISDSNWTGSGILIVNGDARITGGNFSGIIWVVGSLWISGNPVLDGAIFVECGTEFDTTVTGNPTVSFDGDSISGVFGYLPSDLPPQLISWKEN